MDSYEHKIFVEKIENFVRSIVRDELSNDVEDIVDLYRTRDELENFLIKPIQHPIKRVSK